MLSQKDWLEYKKITQNVEQGGNRELLINWYDHKYQLFEGGTFAALKCCKLLYQNMIASNRLQILDVGCGTGDQALLLHLSTIKVPLVARLRGYPL